MMLRSAEKRDIPAMARLWEKCFDDPQPEVESFLHQVLRPESALVVSGEEGICAMLTMLPVMMHTNTNIYKGSYLYGVCTHPDFRGQGWFHKLMDRAKEEAKSQKRQFLCLVPQGEKLFSLYRSLVSNPVLPGQIGIGPPGLPGPKGALHHGGDRRGLLY